MDDNAKHTSESTMSRGSSWRFFHDPHSLLTWNLWTELRRAATAQEPDRNEDFGESEQKNIPQT